MVLKEISEEVSIALDPPKEDRTVDGSCLSSTAIQPIRFFRYILTKPGFEIPLGIYDTKREACADLVEITPNPPGRLMLALEGIERPPGMEDSTVWPITCPRGYEYIETDRGSGYIPVGRVRIFYTLYHDRVYTEVLE